MSAPDLDVTTPRPDRLGTPMRFLLVALGLAAVVLGVWLMANPFAAIWILGLLVGLSMIVAGVSDVIAARHEGRSLLTALFGGVILIGLGIAAIAWPGPTVGVIAVLAGLGLVVGGLANIIGAFRDDDGWRGVHLALGGISMALGAAVLAWPEATLVIVAFLIGLRTVLSGILVLAVGLSGRRTDVGQ